MLRSRRLRSVVFAVVLCGLVLTAPALTGRASAATHTCISNWCSGSDGATGANAQGNFPQVYMGEVGIYYTDVNGGSGSGPCPGDPRGFCFNGVGALDANGRASNPGTGIGTQFYYFGGGASSSLAGNAKSPYCFGWNQGNDAVIEVNNLFGGYQGFDTIMFFDMEQKNTYGWSNTTQAANRQVFNGFYDSVGGRPDAGGCTAGRPSGPVWQPAVYSNPSDWNYSMGSSGSIPNTPEWSVGNCCSDTWPGGFGSNTQWFGSSNYHLAWQFDIHPPGLGDWDVLFEPFVEPLSGQTIGT